MDASKTKELIETLLKQDDRVWNKNKNELNQIKLLDLIDAIDEKIIALLLDNEKVRDRFFVKIKDVYVFKINDFKFFMEENKINNSYTQYKITIGLSDGKHFLKDTNDVVLDFPYKDCILEGGMSSEDGMDTYYEWQEEKLKDKLDEEGNKIKDGIRNVKEVDVPAHYAEKQAKRKEVFFNQILAKDEIDRLLDDKAFVNWKRFTKDGEQEVKEIKRDEEGTIKENLIIKGNNLLALHSLKKQFAGKVKLIYIDPPYYFLKKKKEDTFEYNSNFKLSAWLTFMFNRLQLARDLLKEDGALYVQISDDGVGLLHQLLNEVFNLDGQNNFVNKITVKTKSPSGFASVNPGVFETAEYIFCYAKNKKQWRYNETYIKSKYDANYKWFVTNKDDDFKKWNIVDVAGIIAKENHFSGKKEMIKNMGVNVFDQMLADFALKNADKLFRYTAIADNASGEVVLARDKSKVERDKIIHISREEKYDVYIFNGNEIAFYAKKIKKIDGEMVPSIQLSNIWTDVPYEGIANEGGVKLKGGKKPEKLIKRIIELASNKGDIVLDYHLGSGTTCAVAHKMGRQYIGIEQLDYGKNDSVIRLKNVIAGDKTGISKSVNWQGGGDFIYLELAKLNETAKEKINECNNLSELENLFDELYGKYFLNYNVKIQEFKEKIIKEDNFRALRLEEQKKMFLTMLDLNQMYIQKSEMEDKQFEISQEDQKLTNEFYKEG